MSCARRGQGGFQSLQYPSPGTLGREMLCSAGRGGSHTLLACAKIAEVGGALATANFVKLPQDRDPGPGLAVLQARISSLSLASCGRYYLRKWLQAGPAPATGARSGPLGCEPGCLSDVHGGLHAAAETVVSSVDCRGLTCRAHEFLDIA